MTQEQQARAIELLTRVIAHNCCVSLDLLRDEFPNTFECHPACSCSVSKENSSVLDSGTEVNPGDALRAEP